MALQYLGEESKHIQEERDHLLSVSFISILDSNNKKLIASQSSPLSQRGY